jgi:hypothetical protein
MEHPFADHQPLPLEESNAFPNDSALTPDAISSDPFHQTLSHLPCFDEPSFQDHNPFDSTTHHLEPFSSPFNSFDSQALHTVQPFDPLHQPFASLHHSPSIDHSHLIADSHFQLEGNHQRSGSTEFTPSSPANINQHAEVLFQGPDKQEHTGTVMEVHPDNTYKIQTSDGSYDHVAYHDIFKYGSKSR